MKRRVIWAVAAMAVVTSMLSLYIAAEVTPAESAIVIQSSGIAESNGDKMVTVTVSIRDNPGFVTATIPVKWNPEHLELVKVQNEETYFTCDPEQVYSNGEWKDGWHGMPLADSHNETGLYYLAWGYDASFQESRFNFEDDGVLATLTFKVIADDAVKSTSVWTVEDSPIANLMNWDMEDNWSSLAFVKGNIVLKDGMPGDVNFDNEVTMEDAIIIMKHALKAEIITDAKALTFGEVTGDDVLDMNDAIKVMKYALKAIDSLN